MVPGRGIRQPKSRKSDMRTRGGRGSLFCRVGFAPVTDFEQDLEARGGLSRALQDLHDRPQEVTPGALAILRETSPINHVRAGLPPFLILHGELDRTVPLVQSQAFQEKVRRYGGRCDLLVLSGAPHRLTEWSRHEPGYEERWVAWLKEALARERRRGWDR